MSGNRQEYRGKRGLELIEEAMHALRVCPAAALSAYYIGTLPFVIGFMFFWSDMSRNSFALDRSVGASLGLAVLYFWMKTWQAVFCRKVLEQWTPRSEMAKLSKGRALRCVVAQGFLQSIAIPGQIIGVLLFIPFAWVYAFFQNVTVFAFTQDFGDKPTRGLFNLAARQSNYLPRQNHVLIFTGILFSLFVWLNAYSVLVVIPFLLKRLLGMESIFTSNPAAALFNTTFFAVSGAIAFLCVSPLAKITYTLRCFYGLSMTTGADLLRRLDYLASRRATGRRAVALGVIMLLSAAWVSGAAGAEEGVTPAAMDEAIERVITQSEYSWRLPRERFGENEGGPVAQFFRSAVDEIREWFGKVAELVDKGIRKLARWLLGRDFITDEREERTPMDWETAMRGMIYILSGLVVLMLILLAVRALRRRGRSRAEADVDGIRAASVDLESEEIVASQLPEDEWMKLAREQIERGDFRLAVRALFLASLASLGERELLRIEKSKSNSDYQRELRMRARSNAELNEAFAENVGTFERAWYGLHGVSREIVDLFAANYHRITSTTHGTVTTES